MLSNNKNELIVIIGRPGAGKSHLAVGIHSEIMQPNDLIYDDFLLGKTKTEITEETQRIIETLKTRPVLIVIQKLELLPSELRRQRPIRIFNVDNHVFIHPEPVETKFKLFH